MPSSFHVLASVTGACAVSLLVGCQQASPDKPANVGVKLSSAKTAGGPHIDLSAKDIAAELSKHCSAASQELNKALSLVERDPISSSQLDKLKLQLRNADKEMTECMLMVHGVHERELGEPQKH